MWDIPELRHDRLAVTLPTRVYAGGAIVDPEQMLFIWRTASLSKARGMVVGFYVDDSRLEALWRNPRHYINLFLGHGVTAVIEPDFSLWADAPLVEQLWNTYRTRWLGRYWQDAGLEVMPSLSWATERSFEFCFSGIPTGCPVAFAECRTPSSSAEDRKAFLCGLHEAVRQVRPRTLVIYGGLLHEWWIRRDLPGGDTDFVFLESWTDARRRVRAEQERQERERNQLQLFGGKSWAEEAQQAA